MKTQYLILLTLLLVNKTYAVNSVNPSGVNVNATGVTSVFLTFRGTAGQTSQDAFWCGQINVAANTVTATNPCVAGTFFGQLPKALTQARPSLGFPNIENNDLWGQNFTDVMTIPASVARRAMQSARAGDNSSFFYVRKFESNGATQYIAVTCRMSNGGARVPFALTQVHPYFISEQGKPSVHLVAQGQTMPAIQTDILFNGTGRLKGRWEIVLPGDLEPNEMDLLPEANLPVEQRGLQKRYTLLQRFDVFLPPTGKMTLKGPDPQLLPNQGIGAYQILLRIEATRDTEGNSDTGVGVSISGGVSGFAMPILRYYVATDDDVLQARIHAGLDKSITLFQPVLAPNSQISLRLNWLKYSHAKTYKLEINTQGQQTFSALIDGRDAHYDPPPWISESMMNSPSQWRISAFDEKGNKLALSQWLKYEAPATSSQQEDM
ncbi:hypothetical protein [uncultured Paraglaciecola sp.]|uniref:hypothetical protein n=1 Tax=uncultured Paraglaciecola sp. TaxID=1765024 RepID=UPI0030D7DCB7|tara:strand:- start:25369 stop:26673 length:1305 start_codon:yes stop_codon:yes gene_type:complete